MKMVHKVVWKDVSRLLKEVKKKKYGFEDVAFMVEETDEFRTHYPSGKCIPKSYMKDQRYYRVTLEYTVKK